MNRLQNKDDSKQNERNEEADEHSQVTVTPSNKALLMIPAILDLVVER